jgi:hypothetical protein
MTTITTSGDNGYTTLSEESPWTLAKEVALARSRTGTRENGMPANITWVQTPLMTVTVTVDGIRRA